VNGLCGEEEEEEEERRKEEGLVRWLCRVSTSGGQRFDDHRWSLGVIALRKSTTESNVCVCVCVCVYGSFSTDVIRVRVISSASLLVQTKMSKTNRRLLNNLGDG